MKKILISVVMMGILTGCAIAPSQEELASADYGSYPHDYEDVIRNYMFRLLKDPSSAQYQFVNAPAAGWNGWGGTKFGYSVCVYVNSKNSYGGYTGSRLNYFMIKDGRVISHTGGSDDYSEAAAEGMCKSVI